MLKDSIDLPTLNAKPGQTFIMMGTPFDAAVITTPKKEKVKFTEDMTNAEAAKLEGAALAGLRNFGVDPEDEKTVHRLLKDGADVNAKCGYDEAPLFLCSWLRTRRRW